MQTGCISSVFRERRSLDALQPLVRDHIVHVLGREQVEGAVNLLDQTAVDFILESQV